MFLKTKQDFYIRKTITLSFPDKFLEFIGQKHSIRFKMFFKPWFQILSHQMFPEKKNFCFFASQDILIKTSFKHGFVLKNLEQSFWIKLRQINMAVKITIVIIPDNLPNIMCVGPNNQFKFVNIFIHFKKIFYFWIVVSP